MIFRKAQIFFQEICFSGGKQTIHKVSAAFIVKNCHPRTSLRETYYRHPQSCSATEVEGGSRCTRCPNICNMLQKLNSMNAVPLSQQFCCKTSLGYKYNILFSPPCNIRKTCCVDSPSKNVPRGTVALQLNTGQRLTATFFPVATCYVLLLL